MFCSFPDLKVAHNYKNFCLKMKLRKYIWLPITWSNLYNFWATVVQHCRLDHGILWRFDQSLHLKVIWKSRFFHHEAAESLPWRVFTIRGWLTFVNLQFVNLRKVFNVNVTSKTWNEDNNCDALVSWLYVKHIY